MNNQSGFFCPWCHPCEIMIPKHEPSTKTKPTGGIAWLECPVCCSSTPVVTYLPDDDPEQMAYNAATCRPPRKSYVPDPPYQMPPPPIGLPPYYVETRIRIYEILSAMGRYFEADRSIPIIWAEELVKQLRLLEELNYSRNQAERLGRGTPLPTATEERHE